MYSVEYLILMKKRDGFCDSVATFTKLLETNSTISIDGRILKYQSKDYGIDVKFGDVADKDIRYFDLTIICQQKEDIEEYSDLLRIVRELIQKTGGDVNLIWDDIGISYCTSAYPQINEIENLLRKLITKFMSTNVGAEWDKQMLPQEVKNQAEKNKRPRVNLLHQLDFIHLSDILFKSYSTKSKEDLFDKLDKAKDIADLGLPDLQEYIPKSNWDRYFKDVVNSEAEYFSKRWGRLYELRCLVAHNNYINKSEYDETIKLINEIKPKLNEAISKLDKIVIPENEKQNITENVVSSLNESSSRFLKYWGWVRHQIVKLYSENYNDSEKMKTLNSRVQKLVTDNVLAEEFLVDITPIGLFADKLKRNNLNNSITTEEIESMIMEVDVFHTTFMLFEPPFNDTMILSDLE